MLAYWLEHTDWEFVCVCSWRHHGNPLRLPTDKRVTVVTHDLKGPLPDLGEFDFIAHLASDSHVDRSLAEPVAFVENNVSITLNMLEYARQHPPKLFLLFSSDEVYGAHEHDEWDLLLPSNPYAASKAAQECIVIGYNNSFKIPTVITTSNNAIGLNQDPEKFVPKIVDLIWRNETVVIHTAGGKPGRRCYNPVSNIADALLFIFEHPQPSSDRPTRFNLPGGEELDNLEMAQRIADLMGKPLHYELVDAETVRPGYDTHYPKTVGRLSELGWVPSFTLDDELARIVNHHCGNESPREGL